MNTTVSSVASAACSAPTGSPTQAPRPATADSGSVSGAARDRVDAPRVPSAPLLTVGAVALAQLIPGTVEAEGAAAIVTTIATGVRAAMSNPLIGIAVGGVAASAASYARSLVHDALSAQPQYQPVSEAMNGLNASIHAGLGIPQSVDR